jgi:two-component system, NtrC family, sensor histidine kinase KinB
MTLKTKLMAELAILFVLVVILATLNHILIAQLAEEARKITIENNTSIDYAKKMLQSLDTIQDYHQRQYFGASGSSPDDFGRATEYTRALNVLEANIKAEENNITEKGESEAAGKLRFAFTDYQKAYHAIDAFHRFDVVTYYIDLYPKTEQIRSQVYEILNINLEASNFKSHRPYEIANQPMAWVQTIGILSAILALMVWMVGAYALSEKKPID